MLSITSVEFWVGIAATLASMGYTLVTIGRFVGRIEAVGKKVEGWEERIDKVDELNILVRQVGERQTEQGRRLDSEIKALKMEVREARDLGMRAKYTSQHND